MSEFTIGKPLPARIAGGSWPRTVRCWYCGAELGLVFESQSGAGWVYEVPDGFTEQPGPWGRPLYAVSRDASLLRRVARREASRPEKKRRYTARAYLRHRLYTLVDEGGEGLLAPVPVLVRCDRCGAVNSVERLD
jgi:hypothetical protein